MDTVSQYEGVQKNQVVDVVPQMVVDSIGKENSKFDIVIQLYFFQKLGYGLQLAVSPQVEVAPQLEVDLQ